MNLKYRNIVLTTLTGAGMVAASISGWSQTPNPAFLPQNTQPGQAAPAQAPSTVPPNTQPGVAQPNPNLSAVQPVQFKQLPPTVQTALQPRSAQITSVGRGTWQGTAYQGEFVKNGQAGVIQIAPDGTILDGGAALHTRLSNASTTTYDQLPPAVQQVLTQHAANNPVTTIYQGTWSGPIYQAQLKNGSQLLVSQSGNVLKPGALTEAAGAPMSTMPSDQTGQGGVGTTTPNAAGVGTVAFKDLPWTVQKPMLEGSGWASIPNVTQRTLPDGRTAYTGSYSKDGQQHTITVDQSGNVVPGQ